MQQNNNAHIKVESINDNRLPSRNKQSQGISYHVLLNTTLSITLPNTFLTEPRRTHSRYWTGYWVCCAIKIAAVVTEVDVVVVKWSARKEGKTKTSKLLVCRQSCWKCLTPCLATLRINRRRSKTDVLRLWKLGAATGDLSGTLKQTVGGQLMQRSSDNNNYSKLNQSEILVKKRRRMVFFSQVSLADPILGKELAIGTPLISTKSEDIPRSLLIAEEIANTKGPLSLVALSCGSISWLTSAQVVQASEYVKMNAVYEIGELFELGIQLSYLLILLGLLGVGTFFVIRQVLVRRELDLSAKELQEQVRSGDASATEYFELGAVMLRKFYPAAIKYLLQAIEKWDGDDQDLAQVYNALGVSYIRDGKLEKGITQFETAVKLQPGYVTAWNNLGDAYEKKKELKSALKAFEEVLLFDPNNKLARPRQDALKDEVEMYKGVSVKTKQK